MLINEKYAPFKRILDITFSILTIVIVLIWLIPILALLIILDSRGNPIIVQDRVGLGRRTFRCYKLRTMRINTTPEKQAEAYDERITRVGRLLRGTGIDELPQLWNVLLGDMSVVGPRPHMVAHDKEFEKLNPQYPLRHTIRPGVTGLAQINGCRGKIGDVADISERLKYDLEYIDKMSLSLDIRIIFVSMIDMFKGATDAF